MSSVTTAKALLVAPAKALPGTPAKALLVAPAKALLVAPAKAGAHVLDLTWVPAFAGTTGMVAGMTIVG